MRTRFFFLSVLVSLSLFSTAHALEVSQNTVTTPTSTDPLPSTSLGQTHIDAARTASASEIVKMQQAGLDASVIRAYVQTLRVPYKATPDDILYLHDHKVGDDVICDWIKKGGELVTLAARVSASSPDLAANLAAQNPPIVQGQQQPQVIYQTAPETAPSVVYTSPSYGYSYWDSYGYPYYYSPITLGFGFGWGYPYYYHGGHYYGGRGYYHGGYGGHSGYAGHAGYNHGTVHTGYVGHPGGSWGHGGVPAGGHMGGGGGVHMTGGGHMAGGGHMGGGGGHMGGGMGGGGHGGGHR
jgi:hypothetical protein